MEWGIRGFGLQNAGFQTPLMAEVWRFRLGMKKDMEKEIITWMAEVWRFRLGMEKSVLKEIITWKVASMWRIRPGMKKTTLREIIT